MMAQVVWDRRSSTLVYLTWRATGPADMPYSSLVNELYTARFDGTEKRLIKRFTNPQYVELKAFDAVRQRLFWFETGEGGHESDFTEIDTGTGKALRTYPELPTDFYTSFRMSPDLATASYATTNVVAEYSLTTGKTKVLYRASTRKDEHGNQSTILHSAMRETEAEVIFTVHHEPSDKDITYEMSFATGRRTPLFGKPGFYNLAVAAVSPTGRFLWFETFCHGCGKDHGYDNRGEYYVFDRRTRRADLVARASVEDHLTIRFICWLRS